MINGKLFMTIASVLAAAATITSALAQTSAPSGIERELKLKDAAEVWSQSVCLGDLVNDGWVQSRCAVDKASCCRWTLGGEHLRSFKRTELQRELAKINFGGFSVTLQGTDEIVVTQTRRELNAGELRAKIIAAAAAKLSDDPAHITLSAMKISSPIYVPLNDESAWDVVLPEQLAEHESVRVISTADSTQALGWAQIVLRQDSDVYVAKKAIHPNDPVRPEDFEVRKTNILAAQSSGQSLFRKDQFPENERAKQTVLAGAVLTSGAIERMPSVRLGDTVTLILRSDNLRISTKGVVQGTAAIGDMVTVQLSRYNRTFRGRLIEGRLVEVWL